MKQYSLSRWKLASLLTIATAAASTQAAVGPKISYFSKLNSCQITMQAGELTDPKTVTDILYIEQKEKCEAQVGKIIGDDMRLASIKENYQGWKVIRSERSGLPQVSPKDLAAAKTQSESCAKLQGAQVRSAIESMRGHWPELGERLTKAQVQITVYQGLESTLEIEPTAKMDTGSNTLNVTITVQGAACQTMADSDIMSELKP